jgi:cupredoxin-like protein
MTAFTDPSLTRRNQLVNLDPRSTRAPGLRPWLRDANQNAPMTFPTTAAVAILVLSSFGACLGACDKRSDASTDSTPIAPATPGELRVTAGEHGFSPSSLAIPKGAPGSLATVSFVRTTDQTCATEVVFPELDIRKALPLNVPVAVNVPSDSPRTLTFQCGMGMYKGAVLVK